MSKQHIAIIGGGILGLALAREIIRSTPGTQVTIFEKEARVAEHQTGHNSGVIHAGLYYTPGSLKAELCRQGVQMMEQYAGDNGVSFQKCGKLVIATEDREISALKDIYSKSIQNQVPNIRYLAANEIQEIEPNAVGVAAVHSPETGIINYRELSEALAREIVEIGGTIRLSEEARSINHRGEKAILTTSSGEYEFDRIISCAGLQSDRLARKSGGDKYPRIIPFSGDYYVLDPAKAHLVKGLIYPVPDPNFPFLGVHLTRGVSGEVTVGPNAFLALKREGYDKFAFSLRDTLGTVTSLGFIRFGLKNVKTLISELLASNKEFFASGAHKFVPEIEGADLSPGPRGIRAQAIDKQGNLLDDFRIDVQDRVVFIRNAPSPGATASLAIAQYIYRNYLN